VRIRKQLVLGVGVAILGAAAAPLMTLSASAATNPPWEPDPNAVGTLTFFNSAGQVVTGGSDLNHLFDYAEASTTDPTGTSVKATLFFASPAPGVPTGSWFDSQVSLSTAYPNASASPPLNTATNPVVTLGAADANLAAYIPTAVNNPTAGYHNVYQIRLSTSGGTNGGTIQTGQYWDADIVVDPTAGTWTEEYPVQGTSQTTTMTTLAALPTPSAQQGANVTLTATVTAADSTHPAGMVQFLQDGFNVGSPVAVDATGVASTQTIGLLPSAPSGTQLTAAFTPTDTATYSGSSAAISYTVNPVATTPTISGKHQVGQPETCSEGSLSFGVTPTYTWLANGKSLGAGSKVVVSNVVESKLTVPASAYNEQLTCQASVHDGTGPSSAAETSSPVKVLLGAALKATKKPTLSGPHQVGKTETVHAGTWPKGAKFTYQWLLNGKVIKGATKSTFKPTKGDKGKKLSCRVTAQLTGFANGSATTSSVKVS
jgi:hypothetical protein